MSTEIDINKWVVVTTAGGRFLGRIFEKAFVGHPFDTTVDRVRTYVDLSLASSYLALDLAFDFAVLTSQSGAGEIGRRPFVAPLDFTAEPVPLYVRPIAVYLCGELSEADQRTYTKLITAAIDALAKSRAARSGLTL